MKVFGALVRILFFWKKKEKKSRHKKSASSLLMSASPKGLGVSSLIKGHRGQIAEIISSLEEILLTADVSVPVTRNILEYLQKNWKEIHSSPELGIKQYLSSFIQERPLILSEDSLNILFVFGVNGVGKTTSIAKLAHYFQKQGKTVGLAAADTYRAAAAEQLKNWASRLDIPIVAHEGKSKPSAVLFDALDSAQARHYSVLLVDTAGRLHNRNDLLEELVKLTRIIATKAPDAKVQNLLVLDSTMGQNALEQAKEFSQYIEISGVVLSKWDSSGKGGVVLSLGGELSLPVYFVGVGEKVEDLSVFDSQVFLSHLLEDDEQKSL